MCKYGSVRNVSVIRQDNAAKVDACLAPLVYLLNQFGIETIACCCGHGKTKVASIRIHPKNIRLSVLEEGFTASLEFPYPGWGAAFFNYIKGIQLCTRGEMLMRTPAIEIKNTAINSILKELKDLAAKRK